MITGCAGISWHCESDVAVIADACTKVQLSVTQSLPFECQSGASVRAKVSARKNPDLKFTRHRREAEMECN
ncbi:hypothetical protein KC865_00795 [Candidatus Kaiserbacteria bacterium]|nr:hypothetical protein [Candidatus Kaiserbacteria bacterium]USN92123.1 MAG: hypothetical protein H6782_04585 [Candidatus Nomurabacteria bacterium]